MSTLQRDPYVHFRQVRPQVLGVHLCLRSRVEAGLRAVRIQILITGLRLEHLAVCDPSRAVRIDRITMRLSRAVEHDRAPPAVEER